MKNNLLKLIFFTLLYATFFNKNATGRNVTDQIIAIVNEDIILLSDIKNVKKLLSINTYNENFFYNIQNNKNTSILYKKILDKLIIEKLILQLAQHTNININNKQIDKIIDFIAKDNKMTKKELLIYLENNNINYDTYANYIRKNMIINTICDYEMHQRIKILPYELNTLTKKLMQQNNDIAFQIDHILIPLPENAKKNQIQTAHTLSIFLTKEMQYGTNINELIKLYSNDTKFPKITINKINWSTMEELPTLFAENLTENKIYINSIIGPIHSNIGFHILKINDIDDYRKKNTITKVHIKHIFIKKSNINNDKTIQMKLLRTIEKIKNHCTTFSIEAQQISEDPNSSNNGGDLGWKYIDDFDIKFQTLLQSLKKGEISLPIQTNYGWHLIQLIDKQKVDKNKTLNQENAYQIIFNKKIHETMQNWIQELKTLTYIKIFNNND